MTRLRTEFEHFLSSTAALFTRRKEQLVFYINNYDLVLTILQEQTSESSVDSQHFVNQLNTRIQVCACV